MQKQLIVCGNCQTHGTKSVLGEITPEGYFAVLRFHQGYTKIVGRDFAVICGGCGEPTYIRKDNNGTSSPQRISWVHSQSFTGTFKFVGTN